MVSMFVVCVIGGFILGSHVTSKAKQSKDANVVNSTRGNH